MYNKSMNIETETVWKIPENRGSTKKSTHAATHKPTRKLTGKQQAFIQAIVNNPTQPMYKAVEQAGYNAHDINTASSIAVENLRKPAILAELAKYDNTAQNTIIEVMSYSKELGKSGTTAGASYASTAVQSANSLLDRLHGKATIKQEISTRAVTLNIDLTGVTEQGQDSPNR